jgi:hypothetical protein
MKKLFLLFGFVLMLPFIIGADQDGPACDTANEKDAQATRQLQLEAQAQAGIPAMHNFQEKKILKMLYELRDQENLNTYTYIVAENTGKLIFIGRSIGYGIPYATQYTSPENEYGKPQPEPNGLFMPAAAEGTWVMLVSPKGDIKPVYLEPRVIVSPFPLNN